MPRTRTHLLGFSIAAGLLFGAPASGAAQEAARPAPAAMPDSTPAAVPDPASDIPGQAFAREMIACAHWHVRIGILQPGARTHEQIVTEANRYTDAAQRVAGEAFVTRESPEIGRVVSTELLEAVERRNIGALDPIARSKKRTCDARLRREGSIGGSG